MFANRSIAAESGVPEISDRMSAAIAGVSDTIFSK
jgi:hypothetical protein